MSGSQLVEEQKLKVSFEDCVKIMFHRVIFRTQSNIYDGAFLQK